jgi:Mrp family chromosome partitioning ATPase
VLAPQVDGAILVVRAHSTPAEMAQQAAALLQKKLVGTVLNGAERIAHKGYYQHYLRRGSNR